MDSFLGVQLHFTIGHLKKVDEEKLYENLAALRNIEDPDKIVNLLAKLVPTYQGSRVRRLRLIEGKEALTTGEGKMVPEEAL